MRTLVLVMVLGLILRLVNLNQSFWLDEASQAQISVMTVKSIWFDRQADWHPPLFYILTHFWIQLGTSEIWLRLLPVAFGVANIYAIYLVGQQIKSGSKLGLTAAFLLAINPYHIYYSQEFRMYSLLVLLGTWCMYLFIKRSHWLFLSLVLMMYTHYASVLLITTLPFYVFVFEKQKSRYLFLHLALCILLYTPWVPQFLRQLHSGVGVNQYLPGWRNLLTLGSVRAVPLVIFKLIAGRINFVSKVIYAIYLGYVIGLVTVSIVLAKIKRRFLLSWVFVPLILSVIISFVIPLTQPFRLIFILPGLILSLAQAVLRFPRLVLILVIYISVTGIVMYATRPRLQREQWRQTISYLQTQATFDSAIVVKFSDKFAPFYWYSENLSVVGAVPTYPAKELEVKPILATSLASVHTVYLLDYLSALTDPNGVVDRSLENLGFAKLDTSNFEGVGFIHHYAKL